MLVGVVSSGSSLCALHFKVKSSRFAGGLAVGYKKEGSRQLLRGEGWYERVWENIVRNSHWTCKMPVLQPHRGALKKSGCSHALSK